MSGPESPPAVPDFDTFYRAVNLGRAPFPWQRRLAKRVVEEGWPGEIGVPTGLGKTACIDIAVWALARQPLGEQRPATRIWYVVNRRLLIDAAHTHAVELARVLAEPEALPVSFPGAGADDLAAVAGVGRALSRLGALGSSEGPLHVTRLRGGADLGARAPDPSQPALVLATVAMFSSRWLFRGYGSSTSMRPVDAALAGIDSLVLLDEAHLARPLARLAATTAECDVGDPTRLFPAGRSRPRFVALSATGEGTGERFDLDDEDLAHPVVAQRLTAAKSVSLLETTDKGLPDALADASRRLLDKAGPGPATCVVFVNSPRTGRAVHDRLQRAPKRGTPAVAPSLDVRLVTGRAREREAAKLRTGLLDPVLGAPAGRPAGRAADLVVVATQTLEVGADLDFEALVTETAGSRALVQRLGRLNRLGSFTGSAAVVCHPADRKDSPVYGDEPGIVWGRLVAAAGGLEGTLDLPPGKAAETLGEPMDEPPRAGELLPAHVWEWAKTSYPPAGEAPVEAFFDGLREDMGEASVLWRAYVPEPGVRLVPAISSAAEALEVPIWELRAMLDAGGPGPLVRLSGDGVTLEHLEGPGALRPGDVVVLATTSGGYDEFGWNPEATGEVLDVSGLRAGTLVLDKHGAVLRNLVPDATPSLLATARALGQPGDEPLGADDEATLLVDLVGTLRDATPHRWVDGEEWTRFLDGLSERVARPVGEAPFVEAKQRGRQRPTARVRADAFDELCFVASSDELAEHLGAVGEAAWTVARHIGLPPALVAAVRRAGELHDIGKHDQRFQRWLDPDGTGTAPLAKSATPRHAIESARVAGGWPRGGRHEVLSARLALASMSDPAGAASADGEEAVDAELVVHLVLSHHGWGRPFVPVVADPTSMMLAVALDGQRVAASGDLSSPDWEQPGRFRALCERYGYWGLALLEAVVRQSDHAVSGAVSGAVVIP